MRLVLGADAAVAGWVASRIPHMHSLPFGPCTAIGVESDMGVPLGGVVFCEWRPCYRSLEMACASDTARWLTPGIIKQILSYPFVQLNCIRVTAVVARSNKRTRQFVEHLGFRNEGIARKGLLTDDAAIYGLLRDEWLRSRWWLYGKAESPNPARPGHGVERSDRLKRANGSGLVRSQ